MTEIEATRLVQFEDRKGIIDLAWGHPDPALLPVAGIRDAANRALDRYGPTALAYGAAGGPGPLLEQVADRLGVVDGGRPDLDQIVVTAGNSHGIDLVATMLLRPGEVVLVEVPTYHLALRVLHDHGLEARPVAGDDEGIHPDALSRAVRAERNRGKSARFLYVIPTFHNPTGRSMSMERRAELIDAASSLGVRIIEDDVYRELSYDGPPPPSLWSLDDRATVIRLGSFAKSLAPGLRVGFLTADTATVTGLRASGVLDSGGGIAHFAALVVAEFMSGQYAEHIEELKRAYRARRDAMVRGMDLVMPSGARWLVPAGGYFLWVNLPSKIDARDLQIAAEQEGMSFMTGLPFHVDGGGQDAIRLAFSRYGETDLEAAISSLGRAFDRLVRGD